MKKLIRPEGATEEVTVDAFLQSINYSDWLMNEKMWLMAAVVCLVTSSRQDYSIRIKHAAQIVVYYQKLADQLEEGV
ncbi:hypothetical protein LCGC14_0442700 [marine sediment metagenome]|uniref:Uncharacterized protein n=1 Tax=marine sediment metagenome TaxID=412755 RepID=A0A0F9SJZ9_9ZZZZ